MPSVSDKQKKFMRAAAHNPEFAKKAGIKQSVAREFESADESVSGKKRTRSDRIKAMYKK